MISYVAVFDNHECQGPFDSMEEAASFLRQISQSRGYTQEQADYFFMRGSAVEQVETDGGKVSDTVRLGWLARERAGKKGLPDEPSRRV
jgi:hypothetical protein